MMIPVLVFFLAVWVLPASAQAKTRADCDRIENPMLFNLCLASLAPERQPRARRSGRQAEEVEERRPNRNARQAKRPEGPVKAIGGGRKRIEFTVR